MNPDKQRPSICPKCGSENTEWTFNGIDTWMYCLACGWSAEDEK